MTAVLDDIANVIRSRIRVQGFIVSDYINRAGEFYRDMGALLQTSKLQRQETVHEGLEAMLTRSSASSPEAIWARC